MLPADRMLAGTVPALYSGAPGMAQRMPGRPGEFERKR